MELVLGYLPQYSFETSCVILGSAFAVIGILHAATGRVRGEDRFSPRVVRLAGFGQVLLGIAVAVSSFFIDAEGPYAHDGDHWGGTFGVVTVVVWSAILVTILVSVLCRRRR